MLNALRSRSQTALRTRTKSTLASTTSTLMKKQSMLKPNPKTPLNTTPISSFSSSQHHHHKIRCGDRSSFRIKRDDSFVISSTSIYKVPNTATTTSSRHFQTTTQPLLSKSTKLRFDLHSGPPLASLTPTQTTHSPLSTQTASIKTKVATMLTTTGFIGSSVGLLRTYSTQLSTIVSTLPISSTSADTAPSPDPKEHDPASPSSLSSPSLLSSEHQYHFESNRKFPTTPAELESPLARFRRLPIYNLTKLEDENYTPWGLSYETLPTDIKRVLVVGDIHGCYDELITFLESVDYDIHTDVLISLGDIVGKGPKATQVIDLFYNLQRYVVENIDNHPLTNLTTALPEPKKGQFGTNTDNNDGTVQPPVQTNPWQGDWPGYFRDALSIKFPGLRSLFSNSTFNTFRNSTPNVEESGEFIGNAYRLHQNSRVFVITGNHEKFLSSYLGFLKSTQFLPEESPLQSNTHTDTARDLYAIDDVEKYRLLNQVTFLQHKLGQGGDFDDIPAPELTNSKKQKKLLTERERELAMSLLLPSPLTPTHSEMLRAGMQKIQPEKIQEFVRERDELLMQYGDPLHQRKANSRYEWLRMMPSYVFLPQMKLACVHAGIPPDSTMLFPKLSEAKAIAARKPLSATASGCGTAMCPAPYPDSIDDYYTPTQLPSQVEYMAGMLNHTRGAMFLNLRGAFPSDGEKLENTLDKRSRGMLNALQKAHQAQTNTRTFNSKSEVSDAGVQRMILKGAHTLFDLRTRLGKDANVLPWAKLYSNRILNHKFTHPEDASSYPHILFGHDALNGLQTEPYATGLDTGCCYGKDLSGLLFHVDPTKPSHGFAPNVNYSMLRDIFQSGKNANPLQVGGREDAIAEAAAATSTTTSSTTTTTTDPSSLDALHITTSHPDQINQSLPPGLKRAFSDDTAATTGRSDGVTVKRSGISDIDLPPVVGRYSSQKDVIIPMDLSGSIHVEQPVLIQVPSQQPQFKGNVD